MITLFKVNDIAILSKVNPSDNILRFAPFGSFIIPEQNKKLIERILAEDIAVADEDLYSELIKHIINYKPLDAEQVETIKQLCWSVGIYPQEITQPQLYDYCFNQWTKNTSGVIQIVDNGFFLDEKTLIQQTNLSVDFHKPFSINTQFEFSNVESLKPTEDILLLTYGATSTNTASYSSILSRLYPNIWASDNSYIKMTTKLNIRYKNNGNTEENILKNNQGQQLITFYTKKRYAFNITGDGTNIYAYIKTEDDIFQTSSTVPTSTNTTKRIRINANNGVSTAISKKWYLQKFKHSNIYNDLNFDFNENCISYLNFLKE